MDASDNADGDDKTYDLTLNGDVREGKGLLKLIKELDKDYYDDLDA
jgi:hypothetical protein